MNTTEIKVLLQENNVSSENLARISELLDAAGEGELSAEAKSEISEILRLEIVARQQVSEAITLADDAIQNVINENEISA